MKDDIFYIYKITGNCGRSYVGVTKRTVMLRWKQHMKDASNGSTTVLHRAIRKYGAGWFTTTTLTECYSKREASVCERAMIATHDTFCHNGNGFNLTCGGEGNWGWKPSSETKNKIGQKSKERIALNPMYVRNMISARGLGSARPGNSKRAIEMGHAKKGIKLSEDHKRKVSLAGFGRIKSESTLQKMRINRPKGIWKPSPESVEKMKATKKLNGWKQRNYFNALLSRRSLSSEPLMRAA